MKKILPLIFLGVAGLATLALVLVLVLPSGNGKGDSNSLVANPAGGFTLTSPDFSAGGPIPARFTCDGEDIPPSLSWSGAPQGTAAFALIMEDPDAPFGTWTHWIVYNIPAETSTLDAQFVPGFVVNDTPILFGRNSWEGQSYGGPCPPSGTHNYIFQLFALNEKLSLADNLTRAELEVAIQSHVLAFVELIGTYTR